MFEALGERPFHFSAPKEPQEVGYYSYTRPEDPWELEHLTRVIYRVMQSSRDWELAMKGMIHSVIDAVPPSIILRD
jgi:hypothetical protein